MSIFDQSGIDHAIRVIRPLLERASPTFLDDLRRDLEGHGIPAAVACHDSEPIFNWLQGVITLQGISDNQAFAYVARHGNVSWAEVGAALSQERSCARLRSFWHFDGCGYRKSVGTCAEPGHFIACPLPKHPLRKGTLNQAAYHLALFIRDVCDGDIVGWLDGRLAGLNFEAEPRSGNLRSQTGLLTPLQPLQRALQAAVITPLSGVTGVGAKLWSMALADLLLAGDLTRRHWGAAGANMIAIDSLVHNALHRTGILRRCGAEHLYGAGCYGPSGCAAIIGELADCVDARAYNPAFPARFPRWIQSAIWNFCAADGANICNGNRIDDRERCCNSGCPAYQACDRLSLSRQLGSVG